ncbi:MAG: acyltransferase family protein [Verrucomicrobiota bacterium]
MQANTVKIDSHYRPDIDGLRGVAVLLVLVFHGFARLLPGGFIGVDIFFVISGYLITSILFNDLQKDRFSLSTFYGRRIKRIFPALITVLGTSWMIGWFLLFPDEFRNLGRHIAGGAAFISNFMLWRETGYFNNAAESKPLLHLWSLGIEEQFYIFFPVMLWLAYRKGLATPRFLAVLFVISFGLSLNGTWIRPIATFFLPVTRFWELLVGCVMAAIEADHRRRLEIASATPTVSGALSSRGLQLAGNAGAVLGLALILAGTWLLNKDAAFPGWWALMPTLGTALLIFAGSHAFINRWVLGNRLLVGIGLISYPLYLWHWPLLYFGRLVYPYGMSNATVGAILAASGLLAWLTYKFIESPIRFGATWRTRKVLYLSAGMAGLMTLGVLAMCGSTPSRWGLNPLGEDVNKAKFDRSYPFSDNWHRLDGFTIDTRIGPDHPGRAVLFIGDSHMEYYWPRVDFVLKNLRQNARAVVFITAQANPALPNVNNMSPGFAFDKFFEFAMREAAKTNIGTVVISCFWEGYLIGRFPSLSPYDIYRVGDKEKRPLRPGSPAANQVFAEFGQAVARLAKQGKEVVVILPGPANFAWAPESFPRLASATELTNQVRVLRKDFEAYIQPVKQPLIAATLANGGKTIDPLDYFEEAGYLNGKTLAGRFRYQDADHFRPFYVTEKATFLDALLRVKDSPQ